LEPEGFSSSLNAIAELGCYDQQGCNCKGGVEKKEEEGDPDKREADTPSESNEC
jgi:hypothetical protein